MSQPNPIASGTHSNPPMGEPSKLNNQHQYLTNFKIESKNSIIKAISLIVLI